MSPQEHTADLKQRIEAQFSDLHQFLYQEEKLLQVKLKTEERRELIRLDEHKALLCVEISRLQRAVGEIEEKLKERDPFALLRVSSAHVRISRAVNKARLEVVRRKVSQLGVTQPRNAERSNANPTDFQHLPLFPGQRRTVRAVSHVNLEEKSASAE